MPDDYDDVEGDVHDTPPPFIAVPYIHKDPKPKGALVHGMRERREVPVSPRAEASVQRHLGAPQQLQWDAETDPKEMMRFLAPHFVFVPKTKIIGAFRVAVARLVGGFARVSIVSSAFPAAARKLRAGDAGGACAAFPVGGVVDVNRAVCAVIRECFPLAPAGYGDGDAGQ